MTRFYLAVALLCTAGLASANFNTNTFETADVLASALVAPNSGISVVAGTPSFNSVPGAEAGCTYTNGPNGIADGALLRSDGISDSGATAFCNASAAFGGTRQNPVAGSLLAFDFNLAANIVVSLDWVFATNELGSLGGQDPNFQDTFGIRIDGNFVAVINPSKLSQLPFTFNSGFTPIPYLSELQNVFVSLSQGVHTIELGVCNHGDGLFPSGSFMARLRSVAGCEGCDVKTLPVACGDADTTHASSGKCASLHFDKLDPSPCQ